MEVFIEKIGNEPRYLSLKVISQLKVINQNCLLEKWDYIRYSINTASRLLD